MKPRLYEAETLEFTNNGLGSLTDASKCHVKQAFGSMELEMEYPVAGRLFKDITYRRIILAKPEPQKDPQPFLIYRIVPSSSGAVKIYAHHVCYDLKGKPVRPFTASTAAEAMEKLKANAMEAHPFSFETDVAKNGKLAIKQPMASWSVLGGVEGSILDIFHGEYEFDNYTVRLKTRRGGDKGVHLRYGKNLQTLQQDANCSGCYTGVVPFWVDAGTGESIYAEAVKAEGDFGYSRIIPVDFTSKFETKPTKAQLTEMGARYIRDNDIGEPNVSLKVQFVPLDQTEELAHLAQLERVEFGDTVHVFFPKLGVEVAARVVETCYDVLLERFKEVTIGKAKHNLSDLIVNQAQQIQKIPQGTALQIAMAQATTALLGAKGGAVRHLDTDGDGMPDTIYVADHADPGMAKNVWRWNYMGWGRSTTGVNGPFTMAATLEGGFVADFITTGNLNASLIKTGTLDAAMITVINLSAESITTGKLSVDRLDVDNLVVKALEAVEKCSDGFKGIVKTNNGKIRIYGDDGSVERLTMEMGTEHDSLNFSTNKAFIHLYNYIEAVQTSLLRLSPREISLWSEPTYYGKAGYFGAAAGEDGLFTMSVDKFAPTANGDMAWKYIAEIGQTVLVKTS